MNIARQIDLQCTADEIGTIADAVDDLGKLLDRLFKKHDEDMRRRLEEAWPDHATIHGDVVKALAKLANSLTPPDQKD